MQKSVSLKERTRDFFLRFIDDFDADEANRVKKVREQLETGLNTHAFAILQVDNGYKKVETLSGYIVRTEQNHQKVVLKKTDEKQYHLLDLRNIRKVSLRKA